MTSQPHLFSVLTAEWTSTARNPEFTTALRGWATRHTVLAPFETVDDVVRSCDRNGAATEMKTAILRALLVEARTDSSAARVVLQSLVPGLVRLSEEMKGYVRQSNPVWCDREQLNQDVISIGFECIRMCELPTHVSPAVVLLDRIHRRLRMRVDRGDRLPLPAGDALAEMSSCNPWHPKLGGEDSGDELDAVLQTALRQGVLREKDAAIIFASRVLGISTAAIAKTSNRNEDALRRQRNRAEKRLIAGRDLLVG